MGPPVATRFSGNRGVLSVPYRRLFAGRLEAIPGAYIDKKYPTLPAAAPRPAGATDTCWRTTEVPNAAPWDTNARGPRSAIASYIPKPVLKRQIHLSSFQAGKTGAPPLYFLPEPARPIIAIARMRRKGRWRTPAPGFFWLFAIRELVSNKPCVILAASWWVSGDGQCRDETR